MTGIARTVFRPGSYDALLRALRADPDVAGVQLVPSGGAVRVTFGSVSLELSPRGDRREEAFLACLKSDATGRGLARAAMSIVIARAHAAGADIRLEPRPYGDGRGLNMKALRAFYARLGFVDAAHGTMVRSALRAIVD